MRNSRYRPSPYQITVVQDASTLGSCKRYATASAVFGGIAAKRKKNLRHKTAPAMLPEHILSTFAAQPGPARSTETMVRNFSSRTVALCKVLLLMVWCLSLPGIQSPRSRPAAGHESKNTSSRIYVISIVAIQTRRRCVTTLSRHLSPHSESRPLRLQMHLRAYVDLRRGDVGIWYTG